MEIIGNVSGETNLKRGESRYRQVKVSVAPEIAEAYKADRMARGVSMAAGISGFMSGRNVVGDAKDLSANPYGTRRKRRAAVKKLTQALEAILEAERQYIERIPENLSGSVFHEAAEETVSVLEEAALLLSEAY